MVLQRENKQTKKKTTIPLLLYYNYSKSGL